RPLTSCAVSARTWMPDLMQHYTELQLELAGVNSFLQAAFPDCPFYATTLNMGPQTVCLPHRDFNNLAYGTCGIGALGDFDHRTGGQIILHEPKIILEFRRGDIFFVPSAAVTHENVPIKPTETRYSFTMYTAGGLFRWVACGHRKVGDFKIQDPAGFKAYEADGEGRWREGWRKYSTIESLIARSKLPDAQEK
ncbi:hypothetical protein PLICRDRAFT_101289, partial [Plicaturopsis crispa FD-325 SS-3]